MSFLEIAIMQLVALSTPGPDFFFIVQTALSRSIKLAMVGALGIALGCGVWCLLAAMGLSVLVQTYPWVMLILGCLGAGYLFWLGLQMLKSGLRRRDTIDFHTHKTGLVNNDFKAYLSKGLLTNLSNPKAIIYFASIFSGALTSLQNWSTGVWLIIMICLETLLWFSLVAYLFSSNYIRQQYQKYTNAINISSGSIFIGFALLVLVKTLSDFL